MNPKEVNPKEAYSLYHKYCVYVKTGKYPRPITNFNKLAEDNNAFIFDRFCKLVKDSGSMLDADRYVYSIAKHQGGFFPPKMLILPSAFRIYRQHIDSLNNSENYEEILESVLSSCRRVIQFCKEKNLKAFDDYLTDGNLMIPTLAKHYQSGTISSYFLACIPEIQLLIKSYPSDCHEFFKSFNYKLCRMKIVHGGEKLRTLSDSLGKIINLKLNV